LIPANETSVSSFRISKFIRQETLGGILLIIATLVAVFWANSSFYDAYHYLTHEIRVGTNFGDFNFSLHHWVNDGLMALFFFSGVHATIAGVLIEGNIMDMVLHPVSLGIIAGLVLGKFIGISVFSHLVIKLKLAVLPEGVCFRDIYGAALLAGIGFTMSIFIADLAFSDPQVIQVAKVGIFTASILSAILGVFVLLSGNQEHPQENETHRPEQKTAGSFKDRLS